MTFLNLGDNFIRIEKSRCYFEDEHNGRRCENMASYGLIMPFDFPAMPLCRVHAYDFQDWTINDTLREMIDILAEDDYFDTFLKEQDNDNGEN